MKLADTYFDILKTKKSNNQEFFNLFSRDCVILPWHEGKVIYGKINNRIECLEVEAHNIGHLFGEYFLTKKIGFSIHIEKKGKKKRKKK